MGVRSRHGGSSATLVESLGEFRNRGSTESSSYEQPNAELFLLGTRTSEKISDLPSFSLNTMTQTGTVLTVPSVFEEQLLVTRHMSAPYVPHQKGYP